MRFLMMVVGCVAAAALHAPVANAQGEVIITQAKALAGNITPADTPGFPITISRSGVYKLASDLSPGSVDAAIILNSKLVTLDLGGFSIRGALLTQDGIRAGQTHMDYVTIENGRVINTNRDGIKGEEHWTIRNMNVIGFPHGTGITLKAFGRIENSTIDYSNPEGFTGGQGVAVDCADVCHIESNSISGGIGVQINQGSIINNTLDGTRQDNPNLENWAIFNRGDQTDVGFGNNMIFGRVHGALPMQPNVCTPACP